MPNFLAFDWDKHELAGICGLVTRSTVSVTHRFVLPRPDEIDFAADPSKAGQWLRAELDRRGITAKQVLLALPRDEVVLRRLQVPDTTDQMLPGIVRYQAGTQSSVPLDQLVLDYLPLPGATAAGGREVLKATAGKPLLDNARAIIREAGWELVSVGIGSLATLELIARLERQRGDGPNGTSLVVVRTGRRIEISLIRDRHAAFTHAARLADDDEPLHRQTIHGEISRALFASASAPADSDVPIDRVWLVGLSGQEADLRQELQQRLGCEVRSVESFDEIGADFSDRDSPHEQAKFAGPLGMLLAHTDPLLSQTVDFLRPRQPVVHRYRRNVLLGLLAAAAAIAVLAAFVGQRLYLRALDNEIADKQRVQQQLDLAVRQGQPMLNSAAAVGEWQQRDVNWLEQMEAIGSSMPEPERIYLAACRLQAVSGKTIARVQADGFARERGDVESLYQKLADRETFRVRPNEIQDGPSYQDYPIHFEIDADVVHPKRVGKETKIGGTNVR